MAALIRESVFGQLLRLATSNRLLKYPEEEAGFHIPFERLSMKEKLEEINQEIKTDPEEHIPGIEEVEDQELAKQQTVEDRDPDFDIEHAATQQQTRAQLEQLTSVKTIDRTQTRPYTRERFDADQIAAAQKTLSIPIEPETTLSGQVLVTWYTTDDPENPQNWSFRKKGYVAFLIW
jgi:DHA1 family multidrug resistance protein-like MFS transporter